MDKKTDDRLPASYKIEIRVTGNGRIKITLPTKKENLSDTAMFYYSFISNYISLFNNKIDDNTECDISSHLWGQSCEVVVNYHDPATLSEYDTDKVYNFCYTDIKGDKNYPRIHIVESDILNIEKRASDQTLCCFKRYAAIMDSSIWNYYAPIIRPTPDSYDFTGLRKATKSILQNSCIHLENGSLYDLAIAREIDDLTIRLLNQSYLCSKAHGLRVSPFLFHSEQKMALNSIETAVRIAEHIDNKVIKRRVLFIDDHCTKNMSHFDKNGKSTIKKKDIITARLEEIAALYNLKLDDLFKLHCIERLDELVILEKTKFDIILVDYLLSNNQGEQEYGYQILEEIEKDSIRYNKGPLGKYWLMFTSAFTYAVQERLLTEGFSHSDENWYIGRTACPTTTPELFKYNLLSLMKRQIDYITEIDEWEDSKNSKRKIITLIDYLTYLFDDLGDVRIRAINNFNSLLHLRSRYDRLKHDYYMGGKERENAKENGSPLVQALFPDMDCYSNAFWEHTQHLVYLIAFGNILQWNEMWDEYIFIKENLKSAEKDTNKQNEKLHEKIEKYIIGIKSANFK